jgi:hypothetical protein
MRVNTKKHLARRTFLRGVGVSMGLPLLDSMIPSHTLLANTAANPTLRLGFLYMPHGAVMSNWTPVMDGAGYALSRTLQPLKSVQDSVLVLTGLGQRNAGSLGPGDSGGDHGRGPSVFLNARMCGRVRRSIRLRRRRSGRTRRCRRSNWRPKT